jgi:hypothetical protein
MPLRHGRVDERPYLCRQLRIVRRQRQRGAAHGECLLLLSVLLQHAGQSEHRGRVAPDARLQCRDFVFELSHPQDPLAIESAQFLLSGKSPDLTGVDPALTD